MRRRARTCVLLRLIARRGGRLGARTASAAWEGSVRLVGLRFRWRRCARTEPLAGLPGAGSILRSRSAMGSLLTTIAALASSASVLSGTPGRLPAAMSPGPFRLGAPVATLSIPRIHFDGLAHQGIGATQLA